ncbi:MAG: DUF2079 domain-containing protein [Anaerolineales bacterium]|nr:MAG: DUF2079 domain-containing protein [Anaerolineales bacterium]
MASTNRDCGSTCASALSFGLTGGYWGLILVEQKLPVMNPGKTKWQSQHAHSVTVLHQITTTVSSLWTKRGALILACLYAGVCFGLLSAKHSTFNTRVYDFARFSQALWSTLHGRLLFSSLHYGSILGNHFSPLIALYAPLLLLWDNARMLFLIQVVNVAATVYILQLILKESHPNLAPWFALAAFLNPALHDVTLFEVRRVTFGMPFLALGLYALAKKQRVLMLVGLCIALLAKESMGLFVFMIGFYLAVFEKDWRWGTGLMCLGAGWSLIISLWVIPQIRSSGGDLTVYPQLYYYNNLGTTYGEIIHHIMRQPFDILRLMFQPPQIKALFRVLLPFGFILPFLKPQWALICVPFVGLMFLSTDVDMYQLDKWYMAEVFPVLMASTAVGWQRIPRHLAGKAMAGFITCTAISYVFFSPAPLGGRFEPALYRVTPRNRLEEVMTRQVPDSACVVAQKYYVPHLTHRMDLYHYPIVREDACTVTYYLFDRTNDAHPADLREINALIDQWLPDPAVVVEAAAQDIILFRRGGEPLPAIEVGAVAEGTMHLARVELAVENADGIYTNTTANPLPLHPGQGLRVYLYWDALDAPGAERSVSVRIMDTSGTLLAQHDSMPGGGSKPTSWWERGWTFRDIYDLRMPDGLSARAGSLEIVLYDTYTLETVPFISRSGNTDSSIFIRAVEMTQ